MIRKTPIRRSSKPIPRSRPRKVGPNKARNWKRAYGSKARVEFVKSLPCAACGVVGYSENAHLPPKGEAGTGYKADSRFIAPMCGLHPTRSIPEGVPGCHEMYDEDRSWFRGMFPDFDAEKACEATERAWVGRSSGVEEKA
jgi:hypothetical protein